MFKVIFRFIDINSGGRIEERNVPTAPSKGDTVVFKNRNYVVDRVSFDLDHAGDSVKVIIDCRQI